MSIQGSIRNCFQRVEQYKEKYLLEFLSLQDSNPSSGSMVRVDQVARELFALDDRRDAQHKLGIAGFTALLRRFSKISKPNVTLGSCLLLIRACNRIGAELPPVHCDLKGRLYEQVDFFLKELDLKEAVKPFIERIRNYKKNDRTKMELIIKCLEEILVRAEMDPNFTFEEELCECLKALMDLKMSLTPAGVDLVRDALRIVKDPSPFRQLLGAS